MYMDLGSRTILVSNVCMILQIQGLALLLLMTLLIPIAVCASFVGLDCNFWVCGGNNRTPVATDSYVYVDSSFRVVWGRYNDFLTHQTCSIER